MTLFKSKDILVPRRCDKLRPPIGGATDVVYCHREDVL